MNLFLNSLKFISKDIVGNVLYFPVWWYTAGTLKILMKIKNEIREFAHNLNLGILFKYLFKPMYGMTDIWSRIISFLVRIVHFSVLFFITLMWLIILILLFFVWLLLPIFVAYNILFQIGIIDYRIVN